MKKILNFIVFIVTLFVFASCKPLTNGNVIVCSSFPVYDLSKRIIGDKFEVKCFVPNGVEPHHFEPKASDVAFLEDSKLYIENGLGLEGYTLPHSIEDKTLTISKGIDAIHMDEIESHHDHHDHDHDVDPHIWLNPHNAIKMMRNVCDKMIEIDGVNQSYYEKNYNENKMLFEALDLKMKNELNTLSNKMFITTHKAFSYFAEEYGLVESSIQGLTNDTETTSEELIEIEHLISETNSKVIFASSLNDNLANTVAKRLNIEVKVLYTLENGLEDEDYISLMEKNLLSLMEALK